MSCPANNFAFSLLLGGILGMAVATVSGCAFALEQPVSEWPSLVHRWIEALRAAGAD